ncbi:MAG: hypothetical protein J6X60_04040 [Ruminiclostridium sp.]|nr:hypothetical protein [Ruminiclostridium sp.]
MYDIDLIKKTYFECQGSAFIMAREYSDVYKQYKLLEPDNELLGKWDSELLEYLFAKLWEDPDFVWGRHSQIIKVLNRGHADVNRWVSRLLDEMEKMDSLDKKSKIIIIENMSGRNSSEDEGGVHLICAHTELEPRMITVMNKLTDFSCDESDNINTRGWNNIVNRYLKAAGSYEKACKKYGKQPCKMSI